MNVRTRQYAMPWLMSGMLACVSPLAAVELSPSGEGDALIFPIWATTNGHLSVLNVVDSQSREITYPVPSQAVKLLVRDAHGQVQFSANIYLRNAEDTWAASIVSLSNGRSRLASSDDNCVLVGGPGAVAPWAGSVDLDADHGFIELIVMATVESAIGSCTGLATRWNTGTWSQDPAAGLHESNREAVLRGTLNLVNVPKGTSYTIPATALREFSDIPQHTRPGAVRPDLASTYDSGTPNNRTRSRVCDSRGCVTSSWAQPRHAVAAALLVEELNGEYTRSLSLAGKSDLVFSYPMRHHFLDGSDQSLEKPRMSLVTFDRTGMLIGGESCSTCVCPPAVPLGACFTFLPWNLSFQESVVAVSFLPASDSSAVLPSEVLGIDRMHLPPSQLPPDEGTFVSAQSGTLVSNEGHVHTGSPVIGVVLQQFLNGNLIGADGVPQRANYGVAVPMTARTHVAP